MIKMIHFFDDKKDINFIWNFINKTEHFNNKTILMEHNFYKLLDNKLKNKFNIIFWTEEQNLKNDSHLTNDINYIIKKSFIEDVYIISSKKLMNLFSSYISEIIELSSNNKIKSKLFDNVNIDSFKLIKKIKKDNIIINYYKTKILSGYLLSQKIKQELIIEKNELVKRFINIPHLVIIQVGCDFASSVYIKNKQKIAKDIGIKVTIKQFKETNTNTLVKYVESLNKNALVHGILIQLPLEKNIDTNYVLNKIDPLKDVDCLTQNNIGKLFNISETSILPCTPRGIVEILKQNNILIKSKNIVIVGRSNIVGKPLSLLLLNEDATVTICHSKTKNISSITNKADILISAVGVKDIINKKMVKKDSVIIDVGINRWNNTLYGDVNFKDVLPKISYITPVPKGIGPMTIIMLCKNLLIAYSIQNNK